MVELFKKVFDRRPKQHRQMITNDDNSDFFLDDFPEPEPGQATLYNENTDAYIDKFDDMIEEEVLSEDANIYYTRVKGKPIQVEPVPPSPFAIKKRLKKSKKKTKNWTTRVNSVNFNDTVWDEEFERNIQSLL